MTRGPCAKRRVECRIESLRGEMVVGENDCANPQLSCPREPGEDYTKCRTICQQAGHAETVALELARRENVSVRGARAVIAGHYWMCEPCGRALRDAGVAEIIILNAEFWNSLK